MSTAYGHAPVVEGRNSGLQFCVDAAMVPSTSTFTGTDMMSTLTEWETGTAGIGNWGQNGSASENSRVKATDPYGNRSVLWRAFNNDANSGADGGWGSTSFSVNKSNLFRWSRFVKVANQGSNGTIYGGLYGVGNSMLQWNNRNTQGNPYDFCNARSGYTTGVWYLAISYVFPHGTVAGGGGSPYTSDYGFYPFNTKTRTTSGFGCNTGGNTIFNDSQTGLSEREYLYYSTDPAVDVYWHRPNCFLVDGNEPSIEQLLASEQSVWIDQSGNAINMRARYSSGAPPVLTRTGPAYFTFNGSDNYFKGPNDTVLDVTNQLTVQAWVNPANTTQYGHIFEKGEVNTQYSMFLSNGTFYWRNHISGSIRDLTTTVANVCPANTWTLVTCTYDGARQRIYSNGKLVTSRSQTGNISTNTLNTWIGCYGNAASYFFNGKIATVKVYDKCLSQNKIISQFNAQRDRFQV